VSGWPRSAFEFGRTYAATLVATEAIAIALCTAPRAAAAGDAPAAPSIYQYIQLHRDAVTGRIAPEAMTLPDEPAARRFSRLRWVPGALEGLGTRHVQWDGSAKASQAITLLEEVAAGNAAAEPALYELLRADDVVTFYNDALDYAAARIPDAEPRLHDLARRLATQSRDRGPVKFGIAMLGSMGDEGDLDIVRTLALHDEFGLYAAQAIAELAPQRQQALYDMARLLSGWGRIEAVTLMTATSDAGLRRWLLTEGFRNDVTPQYLAYQCATIADLEGALEGELSGNLAKSQATSANASSASRYENLNDTALLAGIADLLQSLIRPGLSKDSLTYASTPQAAIAFLQQVQGRKDSFGFLLAAHRLNDYAAGAPWNAEQKLAVTTLAAPVINDKGWRKRVIAAIADDRANLTQAELAAHALGIETFELHVRRLSRNGSIAERWRLAFNAADPRQLRPLLDLAERTFGPRFAQGAVNRANTSDEALEAVLQGVAKSPGAGIPIVDASLLDIAPRVRRAAVETLVRWGGPYLREESVRTALSAAVREETDEALKARMVALLNAGASP
jgi:hypothetical protein